jgi:hypothetical protein
VEQLLNKLKEVSPDFINELVEKLSNVVPLALMAWLVIGIKVWPFFCQLLHLERLKTMIPN